MRCHEPITAVDRPPFFLRAAALLCWLGVLFCAGTATAAQFTPRVAVTMGYTDNVALENVPRGDAFVTVSPGFDLIAGKVSNQLTMNATANFSYYYRLSEFTRWEGGSLETRWQRMPNRNFRYYLGLRADSSYEFLDVEDGTGQLVQIKNIDQRRDRLAWFAGFEHRFAANSRYYGEYTVTRTEYDGSQESSLGQSARLGAILRLAPLWRWDNEASWNKDLFEVTSNSFRYNYDTKLARLVKGRGEYYVGAGYSVSRAQTSDHEVAATLDYDLVRAKVGTLWSVSRKFRYSAEMGWAMVEGDQANPNVNEGDYTFSLGLFWTYPRWQLTILANSQFTNYNSLGTNTGLVRATRFSATYVRQLAPQWTLTAQADLLRDEYNQPTVDDFTGEAGDTDTVRLGLRLDWAYSRDTTFSLDYRYVDLDSKINSQDERQNKILLIMNTKWPKRW